MVLISPQKYTVFDLITTLCAKFFKVTEKQKVVLIGSY